MKALISIKPYGTIKESVLARELYLGLGLAKDQWSRWYLKNIIQNEFFKQGVDFIQLDIMSRPLNPNPSADFAISIEFAKHIALMARTEKSHEYRSYLISCEQKQFALPKTFSEALRLLADETEAKEAALAQIEADKHKVEFAKIVTDDSNTRCVRIWVKSMKHENNLTVGEREVFKWLLDNKYIFRDGGGYLPYAKYEASGSNYFTVVIDEINGKPRRQLKITGQGVVALTSKVVKSFAPVRQGLVLLQGDAA
jgi:phage anti-repressor protein